MTMKGSVHARVRRATYACAIAIAVVAIAWAAPASSQTETTATGSAASDGASGIHPLIGGFVGRLDLHAAGETELFGARAGIGFGELAQITGFYWRGFDRSDDAVTGDDAWGGEVQLNLNAGFGLTPFLTGGVARLNLDGDEARTAATAGAGLMIPVGPVLLQAGARDYMFGVTGLDDADGADDITHNWLYSLGINLAAGRRRPARAVVVTDPATATERARAGAGAAQPTPVGTAAGPIAISPAAAGETDAADSAIVSVAAARLDSTALPRNYQSDRSIEIPIPTEGSITLRYGPEVASAATPVVITASPGASPIPAAAATGATSSAAALDDPATRAWLQQLVAAQVADQVADQLARRPAAQAAPTASQIAAATQQALEGVLSSLVQRMDAVQAQRIEALRDDMRVAIREQRADFVAELARVNALAATGTGPAVVAVPQATRTDAVVAPAAAAAPVTATAPVTAATPIADPMPDLAAVIAAYPQVLSAAQTTRGPAAALGDAAFESGAALMNERARPAADAVAAVLRAHPDRRVYVHGHAVDAGDELANQRLSELRAEAVRSLLVQGGVAPDRLYAVGYGAAPTGSAIRRGVAIVIGEARQAVAR